MANNSTSKVEFKGFVQLELTEADIAKLEATILKDETVLDFLQTLCRDGYKTSMSSEPLSDSVKIMAMDVLPGRSSVGYMLSAEGACLHDAVMVLMYKHVSLMASDWRPFLSVTRQSKRFR